MLDCVLRCVRSSSLPTLLYYTSGQANTAVTESASEVDQSIDSGFLVVKGWNTASKESEVHDGGRARHHARVGYGPGEKMASKSKRLSCATWSYHPATTAR